jgi:hypothetical protein
MRIIRRRNTPKACHSTSQNARTIGEEMEAMTLLTPKDIRSEILERGELPMFTRIAASIIAGCALIGEAHAGSPLQDQMQRVIELEQLDAQCTGTHDIDFDRLRAAIQTERDKAIALAASEKDARVAYAYAGTVFQMQNIMGPEIFCEQMFRARTSHPNLREIFLDR